jgi:release factor glutamine methyltransferase
MPNQVLFPSVPDPEGVGKSSEYFLDLIAGVWGRDEARALLREMHRETLGWTAARWQEPLPASAEPLFAGWTRELLAGRPWQYITGKAWFAGMELEVNPSVLIPRPETEELLEWVLADAPPAGTGFLDAGTGSGCLALGIAARFPEAPVYGLDISEEALSIARRNAARFAPGVHFFRYDLLLSPPGPLPSAGVWVSNPPYVTDAEAASLSAWVKEHEPGLALFVPGTDPLLFYRILSRLAVSQPEPPAFLYFELNPLTASELAGWLMQEGFASPTLRKDMQGKERFMRVAL